MMCDFKSVEGIKNFCSYMAKEFKSYVPEEELKLALNKHQAELEEFSSKLSSLEWGEGIVLCGENCFEIFVKMEKKQRIIKIRNNPSNNHRETDRIDYAEKMRQIINKESKKELSRIFKSLSRKNNNENTPVKGYLTTEDFTIENDELIEDFTIENDGLKYELSQPSSQYLYFLMHKLQTNNNLKYDNKFFDISFKKVIRKNPQLFAILEAANKLLERNDFFTLKISSSSEEHDVNERYRNERYQLAYSYCFHVASRLGFVFRPQESLVQVLHKKVRNLPKISDIEDTNISFIDNNNKDIVKYYLTGVATNDLVIEYLSYYQMLEHFFPIIENELIQNSRFETVKRCLQQIQGERKNLILCIYKYVGKSSLEQFKEKIDTKYYQNKDIDLGERKLTKVQWNNNENFREVENLGICVNLSCRIYQIRNAIVHKKCDERQKYIPSKHDSILEKEIPLIKSIAEIIVTN